MEFKEIKYRVWNTIGDNGIFDKMYSWEELQNAKIGTIFGDYASYMM